MTVTEHPVATNDEKSNSLLVHDSRPVPNLWAFDRVGFYMSYFGVGIVYGFVATAGPNAIFNNYYREPSSVQNSSQILALVPWTFKIFVGMLSDRVPIGGLRRRPYLLMGWSVAIVTWFILCLLTTFAPVVEVCVNGTIPAHHTSPDNNRIPCDTTLDLWTNQVNKVQTHQPNFHLFMGMVVLNCAGYVLADVCMDSMSIDLAKRESPEDRGRIQANIYFVRQIGWTISTALGFFLNDGPYGGDGPVWGGHFYLRFPTLLWIILAGQCVGIPFWIALKEDKLEQVEGEPEPDVSFSGLWMMLKQPAYAKLCMFAVCVNFSQCLNVQARPTVLFGWGRLGWNENWQSLDSLMQSVIQMLVLFAAGRYFKNKNWRGLEMIGVVVWTVGQLLMWLFILDVVNSAAFVMMIDFDQQFAQMIAFLVSMWVTVEMAPKGLEGTAIALTTTIANAGQSVAGYMNNVLTGIFGLNSNPLEDTVHNRLSYVGCSTCVIIGQWLFVLVLFIWLPADRAHAGALVSRGVQSVPWAKLTLATAIFAVVWGFMSAGMTVMCPCNAVFNIGAALGSDPGCDAAPAFGCGPAYNNSAA